MVEEAPTASETSVTMPQPTEPVAVVVDGTLNHDEHDKNGITVNATIESAAVSDAATSSDGQKSLDMAVELMDKGNKAMKKNDFGEAADNFSRALEIRFDFFLFD
jgi:nuclear autoantigenic sperm protein